MVSIKSGVIRKESVMIFLKASFLTTYVIVGKIVIETTIKIAKN